MPTSERRVTVRDLERKVHQINSLIQTRDHIQLDPAYGKWTIETVHGCRRLWFAKRMTKPQLLLALEILHVGIDLGVAKYENPESR